MIFNMTGGVGAALNFKVVGGTEQPGAVKDTLMFDGSVLGRITVDDNWVKVSDIVPTVEDFISGYTVGSGTGTTEYTQSDLKVEHGFFYGNMFIVIQNVEEAKQTYGLDWTEPGIYFEYVSDITSLTIHGYTGFIVPIKENTIWVNTDVGITGWEFSVKAPADPIGGMVWIATGISSKVPFNALKKGCVRVYPYDCKQYISGAWIYKDAMSYIGDTWVGWGKWLIKDGLTTHTIKTACKPYAASYSAMTSLSVSKGDGRIFLKGTFGDGMAYIAKVDLTNFDKLHIKGNFSQLSSTAQNNLVIWSSVSGSYTNSNVSKKTALTSTGATLDVSTRAGEYYVGVMMDFEESDTWAITDFYLE